MPEMRASDDDHSEEGARGSDALDLAPPRPDVLDRTGALYVQRTGYGYGLQLMAENCVHTEHSDQRWNFLNKASIYLVGSALWSFDRPRDIDVRIVLPDAVFEDRFGKSYFKLLEPGHLPTKSNLFDAWHVTARELETHFSYAVGDRNLDVQIIDETAWRTFGESYQSEARRHRRPFAQPVVLADPACKARRIIPKEQEQPTRAMSDGEMRDLVAENTSMQAAMVQSDANLYRAIIARNGRLAELLDNNDTLSDVLMHIALACDNWMRHRQLTPAQIKLDFAKMDREGTIWAKISRKS